MRWHFTRRRRVLGAGAGWRAAALWQSRRAGRKCLSAMWHAARFVVGVGEGPRPRGGRDADDGGGREETRRIVPVWHPLQATKIVKPRMNTEKDHAP